MNYKKIIPVLVCCSLWACTEELLEEAPETLQHTPPVLEVSEAEVINDPYTLSYQWLLKMQHPNGLVESAEQTNFVSLYDNALASLTFMKMGDYSRAKQIFDYFNSRLNTEFEANGGGFFQFRDTLGEQANRIWMGDNAWLLIALRHYRQLTGSNEYSDLMNALNTWMRDLQDTDGGLRGGVNEDGTLIPRVTEGIITAFTAVEGYDAFHENIVAFLKEQRWDSTVSALKTHDYQGPYAFALDLHSLPSLIFHQDAPAFLDSAERFFTVQQHTLNQVSLGGYCFDEDLDVVWLEGTAQMALAFKVNGQQDAHDIAIAELEKSFVASLENSSLHGLPYTVNQGSTFGAAPLWEHADRKSAVSSTAWYLFAKMGFNPLELQEPENIKGSVRF